MGRALGGVERGVCVSAGMERGVCVSAIGEWNCCRLRQVRSSHTHPPARPPAPPTRPPLQDRSTMPASSM
jgi:hypothetical protein